MNKLFALPRVTLAAMLGFLSRNFGVTKTSEGTVIPQPVPAPKPSGPTPLQLEQRAWNEEVDFIKQTQRRYSAQRHQELREAL